MVHHDHFVHVAPDPILPRLEGLNQWVLRSMEVLGRVLVRTRIATAYVPADQTFPELNPPVAALQAFLTALCARLYVFDLVQMRAVSQKILLS
jgi:hypothetical protein